MLWRHSESSIPTLSFLKSELRTANDVVCGFLVSVLVVSSMIFLHLVSFSLMIYRNHSFFLDYFQLHSWIITVSIWSWKYWSSSNVAVWPSIQSLRGVGKSHHSDFLKLELKFWWFLTKIHSHIELFHFACLMNWYPDL